MLGPEVGRGGGGLTEAAGVMAQVPSVCELE